MQDIIKSLRSSHKPKSSMCCKTYWGVFGDAFKSFGRYGTCMRPWFTFYIRFCFVVVLSLSFHSPFLLIFL